MSDFRIVVRATQEGQGDVFATARLYVLNGEGRRAVNSAYEATRSEAFEIRPFSDEVLHSRAVEAVLNGYAANRGFEVRRPVVDFAEFVDLKRGQKFGVEIVQGG